MVTEESAFRLLELSPGAPLDDIKAAYRRQTLKYHPDNKQTGNAAHWRRIREAYELLAPVEEADVDEEGPGRHLRRDIEVSFLDALYGRRVTFVHGRGSIELDLPAGVESGKRIRVAGHGERGSPPGDLFCDLRVAPHKQLRRDGLDLRAELPITWHEAAAGGPLPVPTPWGKFWLRYGRGEVAEGEEFLLDGYGVRLPTGARGNLIYTVTLVAPHWISQALLEELRTLQQADAPRAQLETAFPFTNPKK